MVLRLFSSSSPWNCCPTGIRSSFSHLWFMCGVSASLWLHSQGCGVTAAPFCLGHTDVKQFHVPQLYLLAGCKEGQAVGKTFLCDEADV